MTKPIPMLRHPYGKMVYLGRASDDNPAFLLTRDSTSPALRSTPSDQYLTVIVNGLRETWPTLTEAEIITYLADAGAVPRRRAAGRLQDSSQGRAAATPEHATQDAPSHRQRTWLELSSLVAQSAEPRKTVTIVGGGIAGLYCANELAKHKGFEVTVLEAASQFGGRIETVQMGPFQAEFGPMRFELGIQLLV